ncbi:hypothetical protein Ndes2526B_g05761 [Nannochloris sp. 'desiccata']|nr:hypothetical protein KSW81_007586 [Chlorella desiccata (nom. nud.)]
MNVTSIQNGGGLVAATQELEASVAQNGQNQEVILTLGQNCCAEIHRYFEIYPCTVPVKAVLDAILVLKRALSSIAARATTAEQKLSTLDHQFWHVSLFPTLKSCCFDEKWHLAFIQNETDLGHPLHASFQAAVRDIFKEQLILFISNGIASQTPEAGGLCLVTPLHFFLDLASTAAELIGWRDPHVETAPYLRNYGLVNILWLGVTKCWSAVPIQLHLSLTDQKQQANADLSANSVITRLLDYLHKDFSTICNKRLTADVNLIPFWTVQISKILAAYPETAPIVWKKLKDWISTARAEVAKIEIAEDYHGAAVIATPGTDFIRAVHQGSFWVRLARLTRHALSSMPADLRIACIEELRHELHSFRTSSGGGVSTNATAQFVFATTIDLIGQAGSMPPNSRSDYVPLFKEAMLCVPGACFAPALATCKSRDTTADSLLVFVLSLASAAAAEERTDKTQQAWEECQVVLMESSMTPHPYMLSIMSTIWSSVMYVSEGPTTKHFVAAMHELLSSAAATEAAAAAAEGVFKPNSPTSHQLTHLLGVFLASVPKKMAESFYERFLKLDSQHWAAADLCQLAALSAVLRATSLSDRAVGYSTIANLLIDMCKHITSGIIANNPVENKFSLDGKQQSLPASIRLYLAWAVDCLGASLETVQAYYLDYVEAIIPTPVEKAITTVAKTCMALLAFPDAATAPYLPSVLRTLHLAWRLLPTVITTFELETLKSSMEQSLHATPAAAAAIAELTPALSTQSAPPKFLFETLLGLSQSAPLHFLGREAYVKYAKECADDNVLGALPRQWLDPTGMKLSEKGQPVMQRYLSRICCITSGIHSTAPGTLHPSLAGEDNTLDLEVKREVEKLAREAGSKLVAMQVKAMEVSTKMVGEQQQQQQQQKQKLCDTAVLIGPGMGAASGLKSAALHVMEAVENLQKVWMSVAISSGDDAVEVVRAVTQARDALTALLSQ